MDVGAVTPGRLVGRYRLQQPIGEGATGVVFVAARTDAPEDRVALKLLRAERAGDAAVRARFRREARLAERIRSRHVVPVLELGEADGLTYLVLPLYERGSLAARLRERGPLALHETASLAAQLARGLDDLHAAGLLHRDVKPQNVLFDRDDVAALADFGLGRAPDSTRLTHEGELLGTPHYVAPELLEGADATRASDIYALGGVLFECVTGEPPFSGRSLAELAFAQLVEPPPDARELRPEVPEGMALALVTALSKEPSERPTTATALARMLHLARSSPRA